MTSSHELTPGPMVEAPATPPGFADIEAAATRLAGWACLSTLVTAAIIYGFLIIADQQAAGEYFYIIQEPGTHPEIMSLREIVLPALVISLFANLLMTLAFSLVYSQRLAGPIHRLITEMTRATRGEKMKPRFHLRGADEFQDVAHAFDGLLKKLSDKGFINES